jgi:hypothetical protein
VEGPREPGRAEIEWDTSPLACADDVNVVGENVGPVRKTKALVDAGKEVGLEVNSEKTKCMLMSRCQKVGKRSVA